MASKKTKRNIGLFHSGLLETKFFIPPFQNGSIRRPRLVKSIESNIYRKLTIVSAPAGYGKSTLASEWAEQSVLSPAWLSLDKNDDQPLRFWQYVIAAFAKLNYEIKESPGQLLTGTQPPPIENVLTVLINKLADSDRRYVLVLDDFHLITNEKLQAQLQFFLDHLPDNCHLFLTSRNDIPLKLGKLRIANQMLSLSADALRFSPSEARQFLAKNTQVKISEDDIKKLDVKIEGWPAGWRLAALALETETKPEKLLPKLSGKDEWFGAYLSEEILQKLAEDTRLFLTHTAIPEKFTLSLATELCNQADIATVFRRLQHLQLFIIPLDNADGWYRYHHLFRDYLLAVLKRQSSTDLNQLHLRAAKWFAANDLIEEAFQHAIAAKDTTLAADYLDGIGDHLFMSGQIETLLRMIRVLPEKEIRARNNLSILHAAALSVIGDWQGFAARFKQLEKIADSKNATDTERANVAIMQSTNARMAGDLENAIVLAKKAIGLIGEQNDLLRCTAELMLGIAQYQVGNLEAAQKAFQECLKRNQYDIYQNIDYLTAAGMLGDIYFRFGRLRKAEKLYTSALSPSVESTGESPMLSFIHMGLTQVRYQQNRLEEALVAAESCRRLAKLGGLFPVEFRSYIDMAKIYLAMGKANAALTELETAAAYEEQSLLPPPQLTILKMAFAEWHQLQGDFKKAETYWAQVNLQMFGNLNFLSEEVQLARCRLSIAQNEFGGIEDQLSEILANARAEKRKHGIIHTQLVRTMYFQTKGDMERATECLSESLSLGETEGYLRAFLDEGAIIRELLQTKRFSTTESDHYSKVYVQRILAAFAEGAGEASPKSVTEALPFPLTKREAEVLKMVASGLSNDEIADQLCIALSTLKTHINNIYSKLSITSRAKAILKAREIGLV